MLGLLLAAGGPAPGGAVRPHAREGRGGRAALRLGRGGDRLARGRPAAPTSTSSTSAPGDSHAEIAIAAARAGKAVFCEKPLANDVRDAGALRQRRDRFDRGDAALDPCQGDLMKIGVFSVLFGQRPFEETLDYLVELGLEAVEIGTGGYPGNAHCDPVRLLGNDTKLRAFRAAVEQRGLAISALSCHGNPLHPRTSIARTHHMAFEQTVRLASRLGVKTVVTFSGCPGGDPRAAQPNWIVAPWPPEFADALEWQWTEKVLPYWRNAIRLCRTSGVRVAIEMHPNFVVYNPETMLRLRAVAPDLIGCNFDPSHLFWQGIDPAAAIKAIGAGIFHVHAKDCRLDRANIAANGVLDAKPYARRAERAWIFRTVGYGNDAGAWKAIVSALRLAGYDDALSIEHEDSLMSGAEGLKKAIAFLKEIVIRDPAGAGDRD